MAGAEIEQDVGGVPDHQLAGFQERRREGRRALARLHHPHHRRHAVATARDVVIISTGILQCEADIFAASLDEGPVIEGVFHGRFPGRFPGRFSASACSAALTNLQQALPEPPVPLGHSINFNANRQRAASFQLVFALPHNPLTAAGVAIPVQGEASCARPSLTPSSHISCWCWSPAPCACSAPGSECAISPAPAPPRARCAPAGCSWLPSAPGPRCGPRPSSPFSRSIRSLRAVSSPLQPAPC